MIPELMVEFPYMTRSDARRVLLSYLGQEDPSKFLTLLNSRSMLKVKEDFEPIPLHCAGSLFQQGSDAT